MLEKIVLFSIAQRWFVLMGVLAMAVLGVVNFQRLPIDAVPDITNVQVQINTEAPGYSPLEAEQMITFPIETALSGLPLLDYTRSLSRYGLSQVTVAFKDGTDIYFARQLIAERIQEVKSRLPAGLDPMMGPIATGLGEIYMYAVDADPQARNNEGKPYSTMDLRTIQDWIIKPQLRNTPGVIEVNAVGGYRKQVHVTPDPAKLVSYQISLRDVMEALVANNGNVGAGYIEHNGEQYLIRTPGQIHDEKEIEKIIVAYKEDAVPIYISDIAQVYDGNELRTGAATHNGDEVVLGTVFMLMGENSRTVSDAVALKIDEINRTLPKGVRAKTLYDRSTLVDATIATVRNNLLEGAVLVIVVLFLFLGNVRAALITAMIIPLSMLFAITGMVENNISGNLMSLGAIDFGIIVDGAVIIVENCIRRLAEEQKKLGRILSIDERFHVVTDATREVVPPSVFGIFIIMVVYLPIMTLTGVEGKMFHPMAFTVLLVLLGAMLLSVTFIPAAVALFLGGKINEKESAIIHALKNVYRPTLAFALAHRVAVLTAAVLLVCFSFLVARNMGAEFLPSLDEGDIALHALRIPGTSLSQAIEMQHVLEDKLKEFPQVQEVFTKIGTPEIATDPMPPSVADGFVIMKPRDQWPDPKLSKADLVKAIETEVRKIPGNNYEFTQPIQMRFNELIAGVRADVAVKIFGDKMDVLEEVGKEVEKVLKKVPGAADVKLEQITGLPVLTISVDRNALYRYGINLATAQEAVEIALGGKKAGELLEGDRRFDIIVRLPEHLRTHIDSFKSIPIPTKNSSIPLSAIATFQLSQGPNQVNRENGKRVAIVSANIRGRDIESFVEEAHQQITQQVKIPPGYWTVWGGQFEQLLSASQRLKIVVPIALVLIFILLFAAFNSLLDAILVFTGVPLALTGGIFALWFRDIPFSISAGVGFIALSGVAVLNGLVMVSFIKSLLNKGEDLYHAITHGSETRLRPVLITALVASLGFLPMALATGRGAEVQRPLATVVIGGILSSTALTLVVLPTLYFVLHRRRGDSPSSRHPLDQGAGGPLDPHGGGRI